MGTVQHPHIRIGHAALVDGTHIGRDPVRFQLAGFGVEIQRLPGIWTDGGELLFKPLPVLIDEGVGGGKNLGHGAVVGI